MSILKLVLILVLIAIGIRRKIFVGYLLCLAGIVTPFFFGFNIPETAGSFWGTMRSLEMWRLFAAFVIVTVLGHLLKEIGSFERLTGAAQELAGGKKTAVAVLPIAVGLMPMPGGALLSAPLVAEVLKDENHSPAFLAAANYWFRHVMEFFWPLYPGVMLTAGIVGISVQKFSSIGVIMTAAMIAAGYLVFLRQVGNHARTSRTLSALGRIGFSLWPLLLAVGLALGTGIDIVYALLAAVTVTILFNRGSLRFLWPVIKETVTLRLFFMVFGAMVFKDMLELSGAVKDIPVEVSHLGIPPAIVISIVTFLVGLMSGLTAAYVGLSFPIFAGFLYLPEINFSNIFLAYFSGYLGVLLSPTHFCLLLSTEHFKTDLGKVYREMAPAVGLLALAGVALYLLGYPWGMGKW